MNISEKTNVRATIEFINMRCERHKLDSTPYVNELLFSKKSTGEIIGDISLITSRCPARSRTHKDFNFLS